MAQAARVVSRRVAAILSVGAFNLACATNVRRNKHTGADRDRCAAEDDQAAPLADRVLVVAAFDALAAGEDDRLRRRPDRVDARAAVDKQVIQRARAEDRDAGVDRQDALCAARERGGRIGAKIDAHIRAAGERVDRASAQRHAKRARDHGWQLAVALARDNAGIDKAGRAVSCRTCRAGGRRRRWGWRRSNRRWRGDENALSR